MSRSRRQREQTYLYPVRYAKGTLAELLFGHVIYYLVAKSGIDQHTQIAKIEVTYDQLEALSGLTRKTLRKLLDQAHDAPPPFTIVEEEGIASYTFLLKLPHFKTLIAKKSEKKIRVPVSLIENGWLTLLRQTLPGQIRPSRYPLSIMNLFLQQPSGKWLTSKELVRRLKRRNQQRPPDLSSVMPALEWLKELGLLEPVDQNSERFYRLNRNQLGQKATQIAENIKAIKAQAISTHLGLIQWGEKIDPVCANLTLEIIKRGNFHLETHFKEIFYDVGKLSVENDLEFLYYAIDRHRNRPQAADRWQACYRLFLNHLNKQMIQVRSNQIQIHLKRDEAYQLPLSLVLANGIRVRWGRCVIWINDHRPEGLNFLKRHPITIKLSTPLQLIWSKSLTYEYERLKVDLTSELSAGRENSFVITVQSTPPQPFITIKTYIEVLIIQTPSNSID